MYWAKYFLKGEEAAIAKPPLLCPGQWIVATFSLAVFSLDKDIVIQLKEAYRRDEAY